MISKKHNELIHGNIYTHTKAEMSENNSAITKHWNEVLRLNQDEVQFNNPQQLFTNGRMSFSIGQIGEALDEFFHYPPPHIVQSFGSRATLFANRPKSQARRWPLIASLPNSINHKYYKGADILVLSTNQMATSDYHKSLVDPVFSEVIPRFSRVESVSEAVN